MTLKYTDDRTDTSRTPSQSIDWDPSLFASYSPDKVHFVKIGFEHGLNRAYEEEMRRADKYAKAIAALHRVAQGKPYAKRAADLLRELGETA